MPATATPVARIAVGEFEAAAATGLSVHFLRKDRRTDRRIPFSRVGDRILYNLDRVREALAACEVSGPTPGSKRKG